MKRKCLMLIWCLGCTLILWAQDKPRNPRDFESMHRVEVSSEDEVVGGTDDISYNHSVPMAGSPAWNYLLGRKVVVEPYSRYFLEGVMMCGFDHLALGIDLAYVPEHWGVYASLLEGVSFQSGLNADWMTMGLVWRPVTEPAKLDWQLFTGPAFGIGNGWELGTRFAATNQGSRFSWLSGSVSMMSLAGRSYFTIGLSWTLSPSLMIVL